MQQIIMDTNALQLPKELVEKIGTEQVIIREVSEGFLLSPMPKQTKSLRGILKDTGFSTERYFEQKRVDKELED